MTSKTHDRKEPANFLNPCQPFTCGKALRECAINCMQSKAISQRKRLKVSDNPFQLPSICQGVVYHMEGCDLSCLFFLSLVEGHCVLIYAPTSLQKYFFIAMKLFR